MNLDVRHLKLIVAVTEERGLTRAGERLHLTQSALSHQLRDIEGRLGTPLFHRVNKRMLLTPAGERLLESARRVLDEIRRAEDDIAEMAAGNRGTLRLSTECYTCYHWLPDLLKDFSRRFPDVEVKIVVEATRKPLGALLDGQLDLAVVTAAARDKRLRYEPLFRDELVMVMAAGHSLAARPYVRARDFAGENLFTYQTLEETYLYQRLLRPAGVVPARATQVQLTEAMLEMVKAGLGVSVLARWAVAAYVAAGKVAARPLTQRGLHRQWQAALLRNDYTPPYVTEFIGLLASRSLPSLKAAARRTG
jgi:LysR family transcriptional regulator, regulator for metE and metH